jgi:hypothetical protein
MAPVRSHGDKQVETHVTITAPARVSRRPLGRHPCRMMHSTRPVRRNTQQGRVRLVARF